MFPTTRHRARPARRGIVTSYFTTDCHDRLREQVREFAESRVRPLIPEMEAAKTVQYALSRLIARQGWIGVTIGREYGGMGLGHLAKTMIIEEFSLGSGPSTDGLTATRLGLPWRCF